MKPLSENQLLALQERHGQEFYYMVQVNWPGQTEIYARRSEDGLPFPVKPYLIELSDYYTQGRLDGFGSSESIQVVLADPFGQFKALMDFNDLVDISAQVAIRAKGSKYSDYIVVATGFVSLPITWEEGTRLFKFTISNAPANNRLCYTPTITDIDVSMETGYVPVVEAFDFGNKVYTQYYGNAYLSSDKFKLEQCLNTETWPLSFNYCRNVKAVPLAKSPEAVVTREVPDTTGGWAARTLAHQHNLGAQRYNYINQERFIENPNAIRAKYVDIPEATGKVIIPVSGAENFEAFTDLLLQVDSGNDKILLIGRFIPMVPEGEEDYDPGALSGYLEINLTEPAPARLLPRIPNPAFDPTIPESEQNPSEIPDIDELPLDWDQTEQEPAKANFNLPLYYGLKVFQRAEPTTLDPYAETEEMDAAEKRQEIMHDFKLSSRMHYTDKAREFVTSELGPNAEGYEPMPDEDYNDLISLKDTWQGFGQDGYSEFYIRGTYALNAPNNVTPIDPLDAPWLQGCIIEVELTLNPQVQIVDPTVLPDTFDYKAKQFAEYNSALQQYGQQITWREFIANTATKAYMYLEVVEQRGLWCRVYNPLNFRFTSILNVYRTPSMYRPKESLTTLLPTTWDQAPSPRRQIGIQAGSKITLFNWAPTKQYVVDCKRECEVLGIKYRDETTGNLANLPNRLWRYDPVEPGTLWPGYHPACTVVTVSFNGMIRLQSSATGAELYVDVDSPYRTDEDIMAKAVKLTHPDTPRTFGIKFVEISTSKSLQFMRNSLPRPNSVVLTQETGIKDFLANLAFQNGKLIQSRGNLVFTRNFMKPISPGTTIPKITPNNIIERTIVMGVTNEVKTLFNIVFHQQDSLKEPVDTTRKNNMDYYGEFGIDWDISAYSDFTGAFDVLNFWIAYFSNYWRTMSLKTTMELVNLEPYDIVHLDFSGFNLHFQTPYIEVLGSEAVAANPYPSFANTLAVVTSLKVNIEEGTVNLELWLPIIAGQSVAQPLEWDTL